MNEQKRKAASLLDEDSDPSNKSFDSQESPGRQTRRRVDDRSNVVELNGNDRKSPLTTVQSASPTTSSLANAEDVAMTQLMSNCALEQASELTATGPSEWQKQWPATQSWTQSVDEHPSEGYIVLLGAKYESHKSIRVLRRVESGATHKTTDIPNPLPLQKVTNGSIEVECCVVTGEFRLVMNCAHTRAVVSISLLAANEYDAVEIVSVRDNQKRMDEYDAVEIVSVRDNQKRMGFCGTGFLLGEPHELVLVFEDAIRRVTAIVSFWNGDSWSFLYDGIVLLEETDDGSKIAVFRTTPNAARIALLREEDRLLRVKVPPTMPFYRAQTKRYQYGIGFVGTNEVNMQHGAFVLQFGNTWTRYFFVDKLLNRGKPSS